MKSRGGLFLICSVVVVMSLVIDAAVLFVAGDWLRDMAHIGSSSAACGSATDDPTQAAGHRAAGTPINYSTAPPSSGPHYPVPADPSVSFYSPDDSPAVETLVHNLEHGYTIIWYDNTVRGGPLDDLRRLAAELGDDPGKVIVAAWDTGHGYFPSGKHVALAHWGAKAGHRLYCGRVNPGAITAFVKRYPRSDAPEPGAP